MKLYWMKKDYQCLDDYFDKEQSWTLFLEIKNENPILILIKETDKINYFSAIPITYIHEIINKFDDRKGLEIKI